MTQESPVRRAPMPFVDLSSRQSQTASRAVDLDEYSVQNQENGVSLSHFFTYFRMVYGALHGLTVRSDHV